MTGTNDEPRTPPARLTPRESALYARARVATISDLADELTQRFPADDPAATGGYMRALDLVIGVRDRILRVAPPPELPDAPCGLPGEINGVPVLCPFPAGHTAGACSWEVAVPDRRPEPAEARPSLLRSTAIRRALSLAIVAAVEELGGLNE